MSRLILASTSAYRRALLQRLHVQFDAVAPDVDEASLPGETVIAMVQRLAAAKATAVARRHPDAWVIGSDQAAELDGAALGKPGHFDAAMTQLQAMSGRNVQFHTALCLQHRDGRQSSAIDTTTVRMRMLHEAEIARYLQREQPWDCAGSFKSEGYGIVLFDAIESTDPTALIGLPLIATACLLRQAGFALP